MKTELKTDIKELTTLLFDLDNTLIRFSWLRVLSISSFYLIKRFHSDVSVWRLAYALLRAFRRSSSHGTGSYNNAVFIDTLSHYAGIDIEKATSLVNEFVLNDFLRLKKHFSPVPDAIETLLLARKNNFRIVIATNPLLPLATVRKRLAWAGLAGVRMDLITSSENMSRCKPEPGYYREILTKLNLSPSECMMIGDDAKRDMAAKVIGIKTFFIGHTTHGHRITRKKTLVPPDFTGSFTDLQLLLRSIVSWDMPEYMQQRKAL